jgi:hypothetical protein
MTEVEVAETGADPTCRRYNVQFNRKMLFNSSLPLRTFNFWMFGTIGKLLPCALLLVMSVLLVLKLIELQKENAAMIAKSTLAKHKATRNSSSGNYRRTQKCV